MKSDQPKQEKSKREKLPVKAAPVTDYMVSADELITFKPDMEIMKVVGALLEHQIAGAPVLNDQGKLVGLIDDKDCLKILFDSSYHNQPIDNSTVARFMSNVMKTISVHSDIYDVADTFLNTIYKRLLVVDDDGKLVGQISRQDILQAIKELNVYARKGG